MRKGRGFVYSTGKTSDAGPSGFQGAATGSGKAGTGQPAGSIKSRDLGQQSGRSMYGRSPLKRKRSPEQLPLSSAGRSKATGTSRYGDQGLGLSSKLAKTEEDPFDEDDELDDLGTAALEQYELTQRGVATTGVSRSPTPVSDPIIDIPLSQSMPAATSSRALDPHKHKTGPSMSKAARSGWLNPYREASSSTAAASSTAAGASTGESSKEYQERVRQLQEENFTKDGEVKVLRGEKERLMGELRKKEEMMNNIQKQLLSEKQSIEEQLTKEKQTLATKLQFRDQELQAKEQELMKLREKLEQQKSAASSKSTPLSTSAAAALKPVPGVGGATQRVRATPTGKSEFLSTETFMPLSQMASGNVTPVQVGLKRGATATAGTEEERGERNARKKVMRGDSKSPSISPSGRGTSSRGVSPAPSTLPGKYGESRKAAKSPLKDSRDSSGRVGKEPRLEEEEEEQSWRLNIPPIEPTGAQLLMLLVQRDLLKVPTFPRPFDLSQDYFDNEGNDQPSTDSPSSKSADSEQPQKLTGLLSLLQLDTSASRATSSTMPQFSSSELSSSSDSQSSEEHSMLSATESLMDQAPGPSGLDSPVALNLSGTPTTTTMAATTTTTATTPARRSKLQLAKAHTLARTDLTRARTQHHQTSDLVKSHSVSNSPSCFGGGGGGGKWFEEVTTSSLHTSINRGDLEKSIAALLRSADPSTETSTLSSLQFSSDIVTNPFSSLSASCTQLDDTSSSCSVIGLLKQLVDVVCQYFNDQQSKAQAAASSNTSHYVLIDSDHLDSSSISSPKSSIGTSSTISSKTSSDLTSPLEADQQLASQALEFIETLATYSKRVRQQLLVKPPEFFIPDSRPSSSLGVHLDATNESMSTSDSVEKVAMYTTHASPTTQHLMKVSGRLGELRPGEAGAESSPTVAMEEPPSEKQRIMWKGIPLVQLQHYRSDLGVSDQVWIREENATDKRDWTESISSISDMTPIHPRSTSCGQLFSVLLELLVPPWRESLENVNTCLRILTALAQDCPVETLESHTLLFKEEALLPTYCRFSPLLVGDKLGICLDKDSPQLTLSILTLLSHLIRSPAIADLLCVHSSECLPLFCYQCLLDPPPTDDMDIIFRIRLQIIRLVSRLLLSINGPKVVFEKCSCSHELLKSLTALLQKFVMDKYKIGQFSQQELLLVKETVSLMFTISVYDPYFDTHREQCEYSYVFVLNSLSYLFSTADEELQEASLVQELLEYCEEYEDSENSSGSDREMEEGKEDSAVGK